MIQNNRIHRCRIITSGQDLCELRVSFARNSGTKAMYPPCVPDLTDRVLNHLAEDGDLEDLIEEGCPPKVCQQKLSASSNVCQH